MLAAVRTPNLSMENMFGMKKLLLFRDFFSCVLTWFENYEKILRSRPRYRWENDTKMIILGFCYEDENWVEHMLRTGYNVIRL
jgi:hypothetical protein